MKLIKILFLLNLFLISLQGCGIKKDLKLPNKEKMSSLTSDDI
jgi:predicted small lipoprotein YifL